MLLSVSETDDDCYASCGAHTRHAVRKVGSVVFQLESRGSLRVARAMHVRDLKLNLLSISTLEDEEHRVKFQDGQVLIQSEGAATQDVLNY